MFWPVILPRKSHFKAAAKMRAAKLGNESCGNIALDSAKGSISQEKSGDALTNDVQIIVGADVELSVTHTRVVTAAALGVFASRLREGSIQYVIDPLTNALTSLSGVQQQEEVLQQKAAEALAELISDCISRRPSPNDKLIKNICNLACMDPSETPQAAVLCSIDVLDDQDLSSLGTNSSKQKTKVHIVAGSEDRSKVEGFISKRGSELALRHSCMKFGNSLFDKLPKLWECLVEVLKPIGTECISPADEVIITQAIESVRDPQLLINTIQV